MLVAINWHMSNVYISVKWAWEQQLVAKDGVTYKLCMTKSNASLQCFGEEEEKTTNRRQSIHFYVFILIVRPSQFDVHIQSKRK